MTWEHRWTAAQAAKPTQPTQPTPRKLRTTRRRAHEAEMSKRAKGAGERDIKSKWGGKQEPSRSTLVESRGPCSKRSTYRRRGMQQPRRLRRRRTGRPRMTMSYTVLDAADARSRPRGRSLSC